MSKSDTHKRAKITDLENANAKKMRVRGGGESREEAWLGPTLRVFTAAEVGSPQGSADAIAFYRRYQILHIRCSSSPVKSKKQMASSSSSTVGESPSSSHSLAVLTVLSELFQADEGKYKDIFLESWTVENAGKKGETRDKHEDKDKSKNKNKNKRNSKHELALTPEVFFSSSTSTDRYRDHSGSYYVSCILQQDPALVERFLNRMPVSLPPFILTEASSEGKEKGEGKGAWVGMRHTLPVWVFMGHHPSSSGVGCNTSDSDSDNFMQGRPEHTDSVSHEGTWHYQLSGSKLWCVRPCEQAVDWAGTAPKILNSNSTTTAQRKGQGKKHDKGEGDASDKAVLRVMCEQHDLLVINTRLWWHHTLIPPTDTADGQLSASFARDFHCRAARIDNNNERRQEQGQEDDDEPATFTNIDGLYATAAVQAGDIVMRESEMPDAELPRVADGAANCEVSCTDEGEGVLVALRNIACGEFLSVAPSDDDSDDYDDDDEGCCYEVDNEEDEEEGGGL